MTARARDTARRSIGCLLRADFCADALGMPLSSWAFLIELEFAEKIEQHEIRMSGKSEKETRV
jgi:hypothetical protein